MILYRAGRDCSRDTFLDFIDGRSFAHRIRIRAGDVSEKRGNQGQLCGKIKCHLWRWRSLAESNRSLRRERERAAIEGGSSPVALIAIRAVEGFRGVQRNDGAARRLFVVMPAGAKGARRPAILRQPATACDSCQTTEALTPN